MGQVVRMAWNIFQHEKPDFIEPMEMRSRFKASCPDSRRQGPPAKLAESEPITVLQRRRGMLT